MLVRDDLRRYTTTYLTGTKVAATCHYKHASATIVDVACYYRFRAPTDQICTAAPPTTSNPSRAPLHSEARSRCVAESLNASDSCWVELQATALSRRSPVSTSSGLAPRLRMMRMAGSPATLVLLWCPESLSVSMARGPDHAADGRDQRDPFSASGARGSLLSMRRMARAMRSAVDDVVACGAAVWVVTHAPGGGAGLSGAAGKVRARVHPSDRRTAVAPGRDSCPGAGRASRPAAAVTVANVEDGFPRAASGPRWLPHGRAHRHDQVALATGPDRMAVTSSRGTGSPQGRPRPPAGRLEAPGSRPPGRRQLRGMERWQARPPARPPSVTLPSCRTSTVEIVDETHEYATSGRVGTSSSQIRQFGALTGVVPRR